MEIKFLVETALIAHGLPSVTNDDLIACLSPLKAVFCYIEKGQTKLGTIEDFIPLMQTADSLIRIDQNGLEKAISNKLSCALTASATMAVCKSMNIPLAVTCGMGGIRNNLLSSDLPALADTGVALIATSPKDMLDIPATLKWLSSNNVSVFSTKTNFCTGFVFSSAKESVPQLPYKSITSVKENTLILNPIDETKRIADKTILSKSISAGIEAEKNGRYFHPAVNKEIDRLTGGYSSKLQLSSLADNIKLALNLAKT